MEFKSTDRYQALGMDYPDPETMCEGQCEGTGWIPIHRSHQDPQRHYLWKKEHDRAHTIKGVLNSAWEIRTIGIWAAVSHLWKGFFCDGYHFIKCPDCDGTGKRKTND